MVGRVNDSIGREIKEFGRGGGEVCLNEAAKSEGKKRYEEISGAERCE